MEKHDVVVVGAGLSGLTAAICAAQDGKSVIVFEKDPEDNNSFPRSIHTVMSDFDKLEIFLGFDVRNCFLGVSNPKMYFSSRTISPKCGLVFNVERGNGKRSIDSFLRNKAQGLGVKIRYNNPIVDVDICIKYLKDPKLKNIILGVGMFGNLEEDLKIFDGFHAMMGEYITDTNCANLYVGDFAYKQYGYVSSANGVATPLMFSRKYLTEHDWNHFKNIMYESGLSGVIIKMTFNRFVRYRKYPRLFENDGCILSGAYSGAVDPFLGFGIIYAMVSGKIASVALTDRKKAKKMFNQLILRKFYMSFVLQRLYYHIPFSEKVLEMYCRLFNPLNLIKLVSPDISRVVK